MGAKISKFLQKTLSNVLKIADFAYFGTDFAYFGTDLLILQVWRASRGTLCCEQKSPSAIRSSFISPRLVPK